jgi:hypothetical protein
VGRRDTLLREILAMDVKARVGEGRDLTRRMLYLSALIVAAVLMACAVVVLVVSEKAEATFPGKLNVGGGSTFNVTDNTTNDYSPSYSPNGKEIAYRGTGSNGRHNEIYTIKVSGGGRLQVTNNHKKERDPSYSPSGKRIP